MTNFDLFIVRAKTKRGRIVHYLANFDSLIVHKHLETVQYLNSDTHKWIDFKDIKTGVILTDNVPIKKIPFNELGTNVYYGFEIEFTVYDSDKKTVVMTKSSTGNPTEFYGYFRRVLEEKGYDLDKLYYQAKIIDNLDWYASRELNEKRKNDKLKTFTIVHV